MFYKEIIETLFNEFYSNDVGPVTVYDDPIDGRLVSSGRLKGCDELMIILRVGLSNKGEEHYRSLEVTTVENFEHGRIYEGNDRLYGVIFFLQSNVLFEGTKEQGKEMAWLNYSSLSGRYYDPTSPGSDQILAIHIRFRELERVAKPLVVAMKKRPETVAK